MNESRPTSATSLSLLDRLRTVPDEASWSQLTGLYSPLIRKWIGSEAVAGADVDDLVQEVLLVVLQRLPDFEHNTRTGAFRCWLRRITVNCLRKFRDAKRMRPRAAGGSSFQERMAGLEDSSSEISRQWDREHDLHVTHRLLQILRPEFQSDTWLAFQYVSLEHRSASEAAEALNISVNAVYVAKSRVLKRLRQEADGILDGSA